MTSKHVKKLQVQNNIKISSTYNNRFFSIQFIYYNIQIVQFLQQFSMIWWMNDLDMCTTSHIGHPLLCCCAHFVPYKRHQRISQAISKSACIRHQRELHTFFYCKWYQIRSDMLPAMCKMQALYWNLITFSLTLQGLQGVYGGAELACYVARLPAIVVGVVLVQSAYALREARWVV